MYGCIVMKRSIYKYAGDAIKEHNRKYGARYKHVISNKKVVNRLEDVRKVTSKI